MCSTPGDAIDRIAAAIDQLALDARNGGDSAFDGEMAARIAGLWEMISDLDPDLARRALRYTTPADGAP